MERPIASEMNSVDYEERLSSSDRRLFLRAIAITAGILLGAGKSLKNQRENNENGENRTKDLIATERFTPAENEMFYDTQNELLHGQLIEAMECLHGFMGNIDLAALGVEDQTAKLVSAASDVDWKNIDATMSGVGAILGEQYALSSEQYPDQSWRLDIESAPSGGTVPKKAPSYTLTVFGRSNSSVGSCLFVVNAPAPASDQSDIYRLPEDSILVDSAEDGDSHMNTYRSENPDSGEIRLETTILSGSTNYRILSLNEPESIQQLEAFTPEIERGLKVFGV